jgi:RHS repeat-associated protein
MATGISSASPDDLNSFVANVAPTTQNLQSQFQQTLNSYQQFVDGNRVPAAYVVEGNVLGDTGSFLSECGQDEQFVSVVRQAFVDADSNVLLDGVIAQALASQGVSQTIPQLMTIDVPTLSGIPLSSGFSDDPVCLATGHFAQVEEDLTMPATIAPLAWSRTYNSRHVTEGPMGRGWASWADATLAVTGLRLAYRGPDGQVATWVVRGGEALPNPRMAASPRRDRDGWILEWHARSRHSGQRWHFSADGRPTTIVRPGSLPVSCIFDDLRLVRMKNPGGRAVEIHWEGARITGLECSDGRAVAYRYDGEDLVAVDRPSGTQRYTVNGEARITELIDADGVVLARNRYDPEGRVLTQESPFGRVAHYEYLGGLAVLVTDDNNGPRTLYRHDLAGQLVDLTTAAGTRLHRQFDEWGNPVRAVGLDDGVTTREFDAFGNCIRELAPDGSEQRWSFDTHSRVVAYVDQVGVETKYVYGDDASLLPNRIEAPLGDVRIIQLERGLVASETDADGVTNTLRRDVDGQIVVIDDGAGNSTMFEYHRSGSVSAVTDATGNRREFGVDDAGRVVSCCNAAGDLVELRRSAAGRVTSAVLDGAVQLEQRYGPHGAPVAMVNPMGRETRLDYDEFGHLKEITWPGDATWRIGYDSLGQVEQVIDPTGATWHQHWSAAGGFLGRTDPVGNRTARVLDEVGRLTELVSAGGSRTRFELDGVGRLVATIHGNEREIVERDLLGRPVRIVGPLGDTVSLDYTPAGRASAVATAGGWWKCQYNARGALEALRLPDGSLRRFSYDAAGHVSAVVDGKVERLLEWNSRQRIASIEITPDAVTRFESDAFGRVTSVRGAASDPDVSVEYDACGRPTAVLDATGHRTTMDRDERGNLVAVIDAKGARWSRDVDALGRVRGTIDPLARHTSFELDAAGRAVRRRSPDGKELAFAWDPEGRLTTVRSGDRCLHQLRFDESSLTLAATGADGGRASTSFDTGRRLVARMVNGATTTFEFDDASGQCTTTRPSGDASIVDYDLFGRPSAVWHPALGRVEVWRDSAGRLVQLEGPGLSRHWEFEGARLVSYRESLGGNETQLWLEYDARGNVVVEHRGDERTYYRYDASDQLTGLGGPEGEWEWRYDACGRLVEEHGGSGHRSFEYDEADQLASSFADGVTTTYQYDDNGNRVEERTGDGVVRYGWDDVGRLVSVERRGEGKGSGRVEFRTDALGSLREVSGEAIIWGGTPVAGPIAMGERTVVSLAGMPIALVSEGTATLLSASWNGSVGRGVSPWGPTTSTARGAELGYLGEVEIGSLVWLRNRVYDAITHSFLSRDPCFGHAGSPGGLTNAYGYAGNNPLRWVDPLGMHPLSMNDYLQLRAKEQQGWNWQAIGGWAEFGIIATAGVLLVVASGGAATPLLAALAFGAGSGILVAGGSSVLGDVVGGAPLDPWTICGSMAIGGGIGAAGAGAGAGGAFGAMSGAAGIGARAVVRMAIGGAGGASQEIANDELTGRTIHRNKVFRSLVEGVVLSIIPTDDWLGPHGGNSDTLTTHDDPSGFVDPKTTYEDATGTPPTTNGHVTVVNSVITGGTNSAVDLEEMLHRKHVPFAY